MITSVVDIMEQTATDYPNRIALCDEKRCCTYQLLREHAVNIGSKLHTLGQRKPVFIISERDSRCIELFWGCLYSGNYYVPINWKANGPIFDTLVKQIKPIAVISANENTNIRSICNNLDILYDNYEHMLEDKTMDCLGKSVLNSQLKARVIDADPAYMVFTSGSTGVPKGVVKTHRSIIGFVQSFTSIFDMNCDDVFGNQVEFDYDVAAKDIFIAAFTGAQIVVIPRKCFLMPGRMAEFLIEHKVTTLIWSVAAMRFLATADFMKKSSDDINLKKVMFSGEVMEMETLNYWNRYFKDTVFVNLYAPSEVTGNCLYYILDKNSTTQRLPLGNVFPNIDVMLIDEYGEKVQKNGRGEIYVRGAFLSSGYFHNKMTEERFIQNPLHEDYIDLVYRTGDIAEYIDGELYYIGRDDHQIKFMGHRIELYEIEDIFHMITGQTCACAFNKEKQIIGMFYIPNHVVGSNCDATENITNMMMKHLPKYKIPQKFIPVQNFPTNARGKKDYLKLAEML